MRLVGFGTKTNISIEQKLINISQQTKYLGAIIIDILYNQVSKMVLYSNYFISIQLRNLDDDINRQVASNLNALFKSIEIRQELYRCF